MTEDRVIYILLLEDDDGRVEEFRRRFDESGWSTWIDRTDKVEKAIEWVQNGEYDLVLIDHDLSFGHYFGQDGDDKTGYGFAKWLECHPEVCRSHGIYITHSLNFQGRQRICDAIQRAGKECYSIPFLWGREKWRSLLDRGILI